MNQAQPTEITSPANPTVRRLIRLRDHRRRRQAGIVLVDGWLEVARAYHAGLNLLGLYLTAASESQHAIPPEAEDVVQHSAVRRVKYRLTPALMDKIAFGQSARGVVAEFEQPERSLAQLRLPPDPMVLVLDQIEKPGNVGAVFRGADASGLDAIILCDGSGDLFNPNTIRSSLGTVFTVPSAFANYEQSQNFLKESRLRPLAARVESACSLWNVDLRGAVAVILGNEAKGLQDRWQRLGEENIAGVRIPMAGRADSLNVSVSAAVIAYEAMRVRGKSAPSGPSPS